MPRSSDIFTAARNGDIPAMRALLDVSSGLAHEQDDAGRTPLIFSAESGCIEAAKFLIDHGASLDAIGPNCGTAVCWAARNGHAHIVDALLTAGANRAIAGGPGHWAYTSPLGKQWDVLSVTRADPDVASVYRSGGLPIERRDNYTMTELRVKTIPAAPIAVRAAEPLTDITRYAVIDAQHCGDAYSRLDVERARTGPNLTVFRDIPADAISHYESGTMFSFVQGTPVASYCGLDTQDLREFRCGSVMIKGAFTQFGFAHYSLRLFMEQAGYRNIGTEVREIYHYCEAPDSDANITELQLELA